MNRTQALIIGAGPTGLFLAYLLNRFGLSVRIIDKAEHPGTTSRALGVQARTLEFYRQVGLEEELLNEGLKLDRANLWVSRKPVGRLNLRDMGSGLSPFPFLLIYPQDEHEKFLIERLRSSGIEVERSISLESFEQSASGVKAILRRESGQSEFCEADYIFGCDGAHSQVREQLGIPFTGSTYDQLFYVADVTAEGPMINGELHAALDEADFLAIFPLKEPAHVRLIGSIQGTRADETLTLKWEDVQVGAAKRLEIDVKEVHWFSTYRAHHRVAELFRKDRAFLLGDAAHIHSPVGGQGMNTGLGDAMNLAWKIAAVVRGQASRELLSTYEGERISFARRLVNTTDRVFTFITSRGELAKKVRTQWVPVVMPRLFNTRMARQFFFRTISQTVIHYHASPLSSGRCSNLRAGDRLPWFEVRANGVRKDNYITLVGIDWQVHVYGIPNEALAQTCATHGIALHSFHWNGQAEKLGLSNRYFYLVRPDGYIGLIGSIRSPDVLDEYLRRWELHQPPKSEGHLSLRTRLDSTM